VSHYRAITFFFTITLFSLFAGAAFSGSMNKCVSPDGRIEFTDQPCSSGVRSQETATVRSQQKPQQAVKQENEIVSKQQPYPTLYLPSPSSPPIAAFIAWHEALLKNNYVAYKNVSFWLPNMKEDLQRQMFEQLRMSTPTIVKISEQNTNSNGAVSFVAVGCKDNRRVVNVVTVANTSGAWKVAASGWGSPWNETANLCPV